MTADNEVTFECLCRFFEIFHRVFIGRNIFFCVDIEILFPTCDGVVRSSENNDINAVGQNKCRSVELDGRLLVVDMLAGKHLHFGKTLGVRHVHQLFAYALVYDESHGLVLAPV